MKKHVYWGDCRDFLRIYVGTVALFLASKARQSKF